MFLARPSDSGRKKFPWWRRHIKRWIIEAVVTLFVVITLPHFYAYERVYGTSMLPTIDDGDRLIIRLSLCGKLSEKRGDIVVFSLENSERPLIKRVIGLPGETIEVWLDGTVAINGKVLVENYIRRDRSWRFNPVVWRTVLAERQYFMMGDNRGYFMSMDSRSFGPIDQKNILGKMEFFYWPRKKMFKRPRYN